MLRLLALSSLVLVGCAASRTEGPATVEPALAPWEIEPVGGRLDQFGAILSFDQQARALPGAANPGDAHASALRTLATGVEQLGEKGEASRMRAEADRIAASDDPRATRNALTHALAAADDIAMRDGRGVAGLSAALGAIKSIDEGTPPEAQRAAIDLAYQRVADLYVGMIQGR